MLDSLKARLSVLIPAGGFAHQVGVLAGGAGAAQLLTLAASPLLTRFYSPEDFGLLAVYAAILGIVGIIASFRYEVAIPLARDEGEVAGLVLLSLVCVLAVIVIVATFFYFFGDALVIFLNVPALEQYLWLLPIGVGLLGFYQVLSYCAIREKNFGRIAWTRFQQAAATVLVQVLGFKLGSVALLAGHTTGQGAGGLTLARTLTGIRELKASSWRHVRAAAWHYRKFPLYSSWSGFFNAAGQQLPPLLFAMIFGSAAVGLFALAHRVLMSPLSIVGSAVANVFYPNAVDEHHAGRLGEMVLETQSILTKLILPVVLVIVLFGPLLFSWVFGAEWRMAGAAAAWLAVPLVMSFSTSPISTVFTVVERQALGLIMQIVLLVMRIAGITIAAVLDDFILGIAMYACATGMGYLIYLVVAFRAAQAPVKRLLKSFLPAAVFIPVGFAISGEIAALNRSVNTALVFAALGLAACYYLRVIKEYRDDSLVSLTDRG